MSIIKPRRILAILGGIVLVVGCYIGWQMYSGQQMANQYASDAQKLAEGSDNGSASTNPQAPGPRAAEITTPEITPPTSSALMPPDLSPSPSSTSQNLQPLLPSPPESQSSNATPSVTATPVDYKQLMSNSYQQTLQAMQNVKGNTLALQGRKLSLSAYRASILQSQATFTAAETFVRENPPTEAKLNPSYQDFLTGISLAKQSMSVVLNGLSSLSPSSLYAAREMGKTAQQQVVNGYSHF